MRYRTRAKRGEGRDGARVFPFGQVTLASSLKSVGYHTALVGKWHLGSKPEWGPLHFGFDEAYGALAGGVNKYTHLYKEGVYQKSWHRNEQLIDEPGHETDLLAADAERIITTKRDQPLFLYLAFFAVHIPIQEPPERVAAYNDVFGESESHQRHYAACVSHMDEAVGRVIAALHRMHMRDNTIVVFASDNGAPQGWRGKEYGPNIPPMPTLGSNRPLRGWKGEVFEGGIRTPALINWSGHIKPGSLEQPMHIIDWLPTFAQVAGYPAGPDLKLDGVNVWPMLTGEKADVGKRTLYLKKKASALRHGDWKLIVEGRSAMLFNLVDDPGEQHDLAAAHPDVVAQLQALLKEQHSLDGPPVMKASKE
jgi:arylsulfatase A-like enzyme